MAEKENTFLNAGHIYEDVEGETGKNLKLKEDQKVNLVGIISSRFADAENSRKLDERRWLSSYEIAINSIESKILERVAELERSLVNFLKYYPETIFIEDLSYKLSNAKKIIN